MREGTWELKACLMLITMTAVLTQTCLPNEVQWDNKVFLVNSTDFLDERAINYIETVRKYQILLESIQFMKLTICSICSIYIYYYIDTNYYSIT